MCARRLPHLLANPDDAPLVGTEKSLIGETLMLSAGITAGFGLLTCYGDRHAEQVWLALMLNW